MKNRSRSALQLQTDNDESRQKKKVRDLECGRKQDQHYFPFKIRPVISYDKRG